MRLVWPPDDPLTRSEVPPRQLRSPLDDQEKPVATGGAGGLGGTGGAGGVPNARGGTGGAGGAGGAAYA